MQTELTVRTSAPIVEANFDAIKQDLQLTLESYNLILTSETVTDGKSAAAQLNKMKAAIKLKEKAALETIMSPVDGFREKVKELIVLVDDAREKIVEQVKIYEERTKDEIREALKAYREKRLDSEKIYEPFRIIETEDLVLLGSQTKTGNLTKKVLEAVNGRVAENKALQMEHERIEAEKKAAEEARIQAEVEKRAELNRQEEERKAQERAAAEIKRREEEIRASEREIIKDTPEVRKTAQEEINKEIEDHENGVPYYTEEHAAGGQPHDELPPHDTTTGEITQLHPVSVYFEIKIDTGGATAHEVAQFTREWITSMSPELGAEIGKVGVTQPDGTVSWN